MDDKNQIGKKVRFSNIDIIDVECWKQLNLKNTAEENLEELMKLTAGKKERVKNVSCCSIIWYKLYLFAIYIYIFLYY